MEQPSEKKNPKKPKKKPQKKKLHLCQQMFAKLIPCVDVVAENGRYSYQPTGLVVRQITEDDNGQYTCRAEVPQDGRLEERVIDVIVHSE